MIAIPARTVGLGIHEGKAYDNDKKEMPEWGGAYTRLSVSSEGALSTYHCASVGTYTKESLINSARRGYA